MRLTHDALYNLHELAADADFVHYLLTAPEAVAICYLPQQIEAFRELLLDRSLPVQTLSYDTTFSLGDFYLSILVCSETHFTPSPVVPVMFMLHERKTQETHETFFRTARKAIPELNKAGHTIMVTDQEVAIINAIRLTIPNLPLFRCWNHMIQDCKRWLSSRPLCNRDGLVFGLDTFSALCRQQGAVLM